NATVWKTFDAATFDVGNGTVTDANGYVNYSFDPDCGYSASDAQYWLVGTTGNACYDNVNMTVPRQFAIVGQLKNNLYRPLQSSVFNVTDGVYFNVSTGTDCPAEGTQSGATIKLNLTHSGSTTYECSPVNDEGTGIYNCTWDSTAKLEGNYTVNMTSTLADHNSNNTWWTNRFWLENFNATSENKTVYIYNYTAGAWEDLSGSTVGWTRMFNYTLDIYDVEGDTINCSLLISKDGQSTWEYAGSDIISGTPGTPTEGTCTYVYQGFNVSDIGNDNWYKWEVKDDEAMNAYNTTSINSPNLTKSIVNVSYVLGNDTYVNRSDIMLNNVDTLTLRVFDTENNSYVPVGVNTSFWVTGDASAYILSNVTDTNATGYSIAEFNPTCSYSTGWQYWVGGVSGDDGYQDANVSSNYTLKVIGSLSLNLSTPAGEKYLRGDNVSIRGNISDDCGTDMPAATVNFTSVNVDSSDSFYCSGIINEGDGQYNCTFNTSVPVVMPTRFYDIQFTVNLTDHNMNYTVYPNIFWIETKPYLDAPASVPVSGGWGESWTYSVNVTDEDMDTLTVKLYTNTSGGNWELKGTNSSVSGNNVTVTFVIPSPAFSSTLADTGRMFKFNVSENSVDFAGNVDETDNISFYLERDNISLTLLQGNNSMINRSDAGSVVYLSIRLNDTDRDFLLNGKLLDFYTTRNISEPTDFIVLDTAMTGPPNAAGIANYSFNLNSKGDRCDFDVGPQKWMVGLSGESDLEDKNSTEFYFNITTIPLESDVMSPVSGEIYRRGPDVFDTLIIDSNVTDDCGLVIGADVSISVTQGGTEYGSCITSADDGDGTYTCTLNPDVLWPLGYYNITIDATKAYYNDSMTTTYDDAFRLVSQPKLTAPAVVSTSAEGTSDGGWNESWKFTVNVQDLDVWASDDVNVSVWVNLSGDWEVINSTIVSVTGGVQPVVFDDHRFLPVDMGTRYYKFNASDTLSTKNETAVNSFDIVRDEVDSFLQASDSSVDREGSDVAVFNVLVRDIDSGIYLDSGVNVSFWVTINASDSNSFAAGVINQTDASGIAKYYFDPDCVYSVGTQDWRGGVFGDFRFVEFGANVSSTVTVAGQLKNNLTLPLNASIHNVTDAIIHRFTTLSECSSIRADEDPVIDASTYSIEVKSSASSTYTELTAYNENDGDYNATFDTTGWAEGYYDVRVNSSKTDFNPNSTEHLLRFWLENLNTTYDNESVTPASGGWSRNFTFNISVLDVEADDVTCTLFTNTTGTWVSRGQDTISGGVGNCSILVWDFTPQDVGSASYKFQIEDAEASNTFNTTVFTGLTITKPVVSVTFESLNDTLVNRSAGSDILVVRVYDTENKSYVNDSNVTFWVTTDGQGLDAGSVFTTNSTGQASFAFTPTCTPYYETGYQLWLAGVTDDNYVNSNTSSNYTITVYGQMTNLVSSPAGEKYLRGEDNVTIRANITSDCSSQETMNETLVNFTIVSQYTGTPYGCTTEIYNETTGYYNCTFDTSGKEPRGYNITMNSTQEFYITDISTEVYSPATESFWIETRPTLVASNVTPESGGWGEKHYFTVNATDYDLDTLIVKAWFREASESYTIINSLTNNTISGSDQYVTFSSKIFNNVYAGTTWYYKFNVTAADGDGYINETVEKSFYVEPDTVYIEYITGNNTIVNRSAQVTDSDYNVTFITRAWDVDKNPDEFIPFRQSKFYLTNDNFNNYVPYPSAPTSYINTNATGYQTYTFTPDCSYAVGPQKWKSGLIDNDPYNSTNSTEFYFNITTTPLVAMLDYPMGGGITFEKGIDNILLRGNVSDDCGPVSGANVNISVVQGGTTYAECYPAGDEDSGWYNCTIANTTHNSWPVGLYNVTLKADKPYYNDSDIFVVEDAFRLVTRPVLSSPTATSTQGGTVGGWGEDWTFTVDILDADGDSSNVSLWINRTGSWELMDSVIWAQGNPTITFAGKTFSCAAALDLGVKQYKFNVSDDYDYTDNISSTMTIEKDDVDVIPTSTGGQSVDRNGTATILLKTQIMDTDKAYAPVGSGVDGMTWVTVNGSDLDSYDDGHSLQTDASGYLNYDFDINCSYTTGEHAWRGGTSSSTCYKDSTSSTIYFDSVGKLYTDIELPVNGSSYGTGTSIVMRANVTSDCVDEGLIDSESKGFELKSPSSSWYGCAPINEETGPDAGWYNCSWDSTFKQPGNWTIRTNASNDTYYTAVNTWVDHFELLNNPAEYSDMDVTPDSGAWGTLYTFTVNFTDSDADTIDCDLYVTTDNGATWELRNSTTLASPAVCNLTVSDFDCGDIGTDNYFKFGLDDGYNSINTTNMSGPNISINDIEIIYVSGNDQDVDRSYGVLPLKVYVNDTVRGISVSPDVEVYFNITTDGSSYVLEGSNTTEDGNATYSFTPSCSYYEGEQTWYAEVNDSCYTPKNTTEYNLTVYGTLTNTLDVPTGVEYFLNNNITLRANVTSDCPAEVMNDTEVTFRYFRTGYSNTCSVENETTGYYNCTFNNTGMPPGYYDFEMNSSKSFYNTDSRVFSYVYGISSFWLETLPILTAPAVSPGVGGWGETFYFVTNATDRDLDMMTVKLWLRKKSGGSWIMKNSTTVQGINQTVNLSTKFPSGGDMDDWEFNFTVTADDAWDVYGTSNVSFTVEANDVRIEILSGNDTIVNRSSLPGNSNPEVTFAVRIFDDDLDALIMYPANTRFYVTKDGSNFETLATVSNDTSEFYVTLDPDCTYDIGPQMWKVSSVFSGNSWYKLTNTSDQYFNITTVPLSTELAEPVDGATRVRDVDDILLHVNITDECGLVAGASPVITVERLATSYFTCPPDDTVSDEGDGYYNCTIPAASTSGWFTGDYDIKIDSSKAYYNSSETNMYNSAFRLVTVPKVDNSVITSMSAMGSSDFGWGEDWTFKVDILDEDNDNVNVYLWANLTGDWELLNSTVCTNCGGSTHTIEFTGHDFVCTDIGTRDFKFNVSDDYSYTNETSGTFNIIKDDTITYYSIGDSSQIDREGNDAEIFAVRVRDADVNTYVGTTIPNATGKIFVTTDGVTYDAGTQNQTDVSGYIYYTFNPDCSYDVGAQTWYGGPRDDACYKDSNSQISNTDIVGQLKSSIIDPVYSSSVLVGDIVNLNVSIFDECLVQVSGATITHQASSPSYELESILPVADAGDGYYNSTWDTMFHQGGNWSFMINSSKADHYSNSTLFNEWLYLNNTVPVVENFTVSPEVEGWGRVYTYEAQIFDTQFDNITCDLYVSTDNGALWVLKNSTFIETVPTSGRTNCTLSLSNFDCSEIGTDNLYKFQIFDGTNLFNTSSISGPNITADTVSIDYILGDGSVVNRSAAQTTLFSALVLDVDKGSIPVMGASSVTFWTTKDNIVYDAGISVSTNSTGYADYNFNPECSPVYYQVGAQYWKAGVTDSCYTQTNFTQENYTTTIMGDLINTIENPAYGTEYLRGENVTLSSVSSPTITDDCLLGLENIENDITFYNEDEVSNYSCISDEMAGGYYQCIRNTTDMAARWYDTEMVSWELYYNNGTVLLQNHIFVTTVPNMTDETAITSVGGWGETFYFSVNVTDEDLDNLTLNLYIRDTASGFWGAPKNSTILYSPQGEYAVLSWSDAPYCTIGTWEYRFEASDTHGHVSFTTPHNFTIEKDDVLVQYSVGDGSYVWRNGSDSTTLTLDIVDSDRNDISVGTGTSARFWVTTDADDSGSWDIGKDTATLEGSMDYYFMQQFPDGGQKCDYTVGIQKWKGGTFNDVCYKDVNSTEYDLSVNSSLVPNITNVYSQGYLRGDHIPLLAS
ncbi:MAG: hypothetical protein KAI18_00155, partial [Candidatus Aenigmarchaeota archaeon]|nr:hypothetical protein [Candidatus Aenigmarchaeota archaeon]